MFVRANTPLFLNREDLHNTHYDFLDGFRGLAVAFVLLSHLSNVNMPVIHSFNFSGSGKYGVFLFFVLSAFLLTLPILRLSKDQLFFKKRWANYAVRRFLRIFPLFTVILLISFVFRKSGVFIPISSSDLIQHLTLQAGKDIFWTIPVEFKYYVVLPIVAILFVKMGNKVAPSIMLVGISILLIEVVFWPAQLSGVNTVSLGPYLPIFLIGSLSALIHYKASNYQLVNGSLISVAIELVGFTVLIIPFLLVPGIYSALSGEQISLSYFHRDFLLFGVIWSIVLLAAIHGTGMLRRIFSAWPIRFLGVISFSVYIWHMPVILTFKKFGVDNALSGIMALIVTVLIASLSYRYIERPFLRYRIPSARRLHDNTLVSRTNAVCRK